MNWKIIALQCSQPVHISEDQEPFVCLFVLFFAQSNALMRDILPQRNIPNADSVREAISQAVLVNHSREDWGISETPRVGKPWDVCDP